MSISLSQYPSHATATLGESDHVFAHDVARAEAALAVATPGYVRDVPFVHRAHHDKYLRVAGGKDTACVYGPRCVGLQVANVLGPLISYLEPWEEDEPAEGKPCLLCRRNNETMVATLFVPPAQYTIDAGRLVSCDDDAIRRTVNTHQVFTNIPGEYPADAVIQLPSGTVTPILVGTVISFNLFNYNGVVDDGEQTRVEQLFDADF